jgi:hypothetical protein
MNQADALKRLEALETQNQLADIERSLADPETWARAQQYADDFDVNVEVVIKESMHIARRIAEIGQDAFDREFAAELGVTVMDLRSEAWRSEQDREWQRDLWGSSQTSPALVGGPQVCIIETVESQEV